MTKQNFCRLCHQLVASLLAALLTITQRYALGMKWLSSMLSMGRTVLSSSSTVIGNSAFFIAQTNSSQPVHHLTHVVWYRAPAGVLFRPYDLLVTTREEVGPEYFTISATGVMHIKKGEQSSFTSLGEWMKDEAMFNLISKIKYFRTYLIGRCFRRWHKVCCVDYSMPQLPVAKA